MKPSNAETTVDRPLDFPALLQLLGDKDRNGLERALAAYEKKLGPAATARWRRLACSLMTLAPTRPRLAGGANLKFYIPDGKYYQQVFALQARPDGGFTIYAPDVLAEAMKRGLLKRSSAPRTYPLEASGEPMVLDALDGKTADQEEFYRDLTGWNRKAMRISLESDATAEQMRAAEELCALGARQWR